VLASTVTLGTGGACRVYEGWASNHGGGVNTSTRGSDEEAQSFAWDKVKCLTV